MKGFLLYLFLGMLAILLRTSVFPLFFSPGFCPDLILGLIIYLGLSENMLRAVLLALLLGGMQDSFSGSSLGLSVFVCLSILLLVRLLSEHLNVESAPLLILLILCGTFIQQILLATCLVLFADAGAVLQIMLPTLAEQLLTNLIAYSLLLVLVLRLQHLFGYRSGLAGLVYQSKHHGA